MKTFIETSLGVIMFFSMCLVGAEAEGFTTQLVWSGSMLAISAASVVVINKLEKEDNK